MRSLILLGFVLAAVSAFGDKEKLEVKHWTMMKAMESCLGEDAINSYFVKMKKAASKCHKVDAPELDLPMFRDASGLINSLVEEPSEENKSLDELMERYIQIEMLKRLRNPRSRYRRQAIEVEDVEDEEEEEVEIDEDDMEDMKLDKRLTKKLLKKKQQIENKRSNMTCVFRELGYLNDKDEFDDESIEKMGDDLVIEDPWLKEKLYEGCKLCRQFQKALPQEFYDQCEHDEGVGRVMVYKKCSKMQMIKTCMKYDIKKKIESSLGPVEEVVKETGLEENDLFSAYKHLMSGPEKLLF